MATATLTKRQTKTKSSPLSAQKLDESGSNEAVEGEDSPSFFMPTGSMSLDEFRQWTYSDDFPKSGLIAYLGKEIFVDMSPERLVSHASVKTAISGTIIPLVFKKNSGKVYFDRARIVNVAAEVSNEPDGVFARWESFKNRMVRMVPTKDEDDFIELEGTPDWVLEVVSRSSVTKDKKTLRERYHRAGIAEYWLIDVRHDEVEFEILIHGKDDYELTKSIGQWQISKTFGKKFRLRRIIDELGNIDYRLDVKEA